MKLPKNNSLSLTHPSFSPLLPSFSFPSFLPSFFNGELPQNLGIGVSILGFPLLDFYLHKSFSKCEFGLGFAVLSIILSNMGIRFIFISKNNIYKFYFFKVWDTGGI